MIGAISVLGLRLKINLPLAAESIELVDIGAAQKRLQSLIDIVKLKTLFQHAVLIHFHKKLWHRRAESGDQRGEFRSLSAGRK